MPCPSLTMPGPLRHNCPSLQRVALRGLSQLGVNLSQWPEQNRRPICLPQGGTYSVINLDLELRTEPFFPFPSHPLAVLFQDNRSTSRALKEALLKEWTSSENTRWVMATDYWTAMVIHSLLLPHLDILVIPHWWNIIRIPTKSSPSENNHVHSWRADLRCPSSCWHWADVSAEREAQPRPSLPGHLAT